VRLIFKGDKNPQGAFLRRKIQPSAHILRFHDISPCGV
jgi:hypothetical protein